MALLSRGWDVIEADGIGLVAPQVALFLFVTAILNSHVTLCKFYLHGL